MGCDIDMQVFRSDFEQAAFGSVKQLFPHASVECCFFHFAQANWRKVVELGLRDAYMTDFDFSLQVRQLTALAFVPPEHQSGISGNENITPRFM